MNKTIAIELLDWVLVNIIAPFAIPWFFAFVWNIVPSINHISLLNLLLSNSLINLLLSNGVYTFFALLVFISLYQDYRMAPNSFNIPLQLLIWISSIFSFVIFGSSIGFIERITNEMIAAVTFPFLSFALYYKFRITRYKYKKQKK